MSEGWAARVVESRLGEGQVMAFSDAPGQLEFNY
tara:strand:+ start:339 stop:440 length:102 start_codon:yes stop_codon:yes gene_type:complete